MATQDNSIQTFKFAEGVTVRSTLDENGSPWFVATDVCAALGLSNTPKSLQRLDDDEKTTLTNSYSRAGNGAQEFNIINESGLYSLILTSRKAEAKRFKKWVTSEVLPSIRKTGGYGMKPSIAHQPSQPVYDPSEFYLIHKSSLDSGACVCTPNHYGTLTTSPILPEAVALLKAARSFVETLKQDGFLMLRPEDVLKKLVM